jgi:hypothetical protein
MPGAAAQTQRRARSKITPCPDTLPNNRSRNDAGAQRTPNRPKRDFRAPDGAVNAGACRTGGPGPITSATFHLKEASPVALLYGRRRVPGGQHSAHRAVLPGCRRQRPLNFS